MGVTIESPNYSIDMGYGGFNNIRKKVADLAGADIGQHYRGLETAPMFDFVGERTAFFKAYDAETQRISQKYHGEKDGILNFLYKPDSGSTLSAEDCKQVYEIIKDYDDDILYGYAGRPDCAKFKDFKQLVKDCIDNKTDMEWW